MAVPVMGANSKFVLEHEGELHSYLKYFLKQFLISTTKSKIIVCFILLHTYSIKAKVILYVFFVIMIKISNCIISMYSYITK